MATPLFTDAEPVYERYFWPGLILALALIAGGVVLVGWLDSNEPGALAPVSSPQQPPGYEAPAK